MDVFRVHFVNVEEGVDVGYGLGNDVRFVFRAMLIDVDVLDEGKYLGESVVGK